VYALSAGLEEEGLCRRRVVYATNQGQGESPALGRLYEKKDFMKDI